MPRRNPDSAPGDWYIDTVCINCAASRHVAPGLIVERGDKSVFARQPANEKEEMMAWRARLVCPTASVRTQAKRQRPEGIFPQELAPGVYRCGFNSKDSYGAHSYFVARAEGNLLVDSPRYALELRKFLDGAGGIKDILLSHRDDVADADKYAEAFGARVWIHHDDARAAPYAKNRIEGMNEIKIRDALLAIPLPGHTKGSVAYLLERPSARAGDEPGAACARAAHEDLALDGLFGGDGFAEARRAQPPEEGQLEAAGADAEVKAEDVDFEPVDTARRDAKQSGERELKAAAAGRSGEHGAAEIVLADGGRRQVELELRHVARDPSGERVGVRAWPERVLLRVGIVARRLVDALDELVDAGTALFEVQLGLGAEPRRVGLPGADHERRIRPAQPPADHFVDGIRHGVARLDRHPGMHREPSFDTPRARAVDLDHRLRGVARLGCGKSVRGPGRSGGGEDQRS